MERLRYGLIDTLRGAAIFGVIVYHFIYDLIHFYSMEIPWFYSTPVYLVQQAGVWLFVFISGAMSLCAKNPLRNGLLLVGCGLMITLATYFYSPANIIVFGILSLLGWAAIITVLARPILEKIPIKLGLALSLFLFFLTHEMAEGRLSLLQVHVYDLPLSWYDSRFLFPLGLPHASFTSADYFPLLPWIFAYWLGYFCWQMTDEELREKYFFRQLSGFAFMGRHSLFLYLIHQPIILAVISLVF
ncbi:MAG: heparan-alpha-glucosaminide N-acetyltransferase [Acidaminococcaceae bacterium]